MQRRGRVFVNRFHIRVKLFVRALADSRLIVLGLSQNRVRETKPLDESLLANWFTPRLFVASSHSIGVPLLETRR